jgi:hypothetical protein
MFFISGTGSKNVEALLNKTLWYNFVKINRGVPNYSSFFWLPSKSNMHLQSMLGFT